MSNGCVIARRIDTWPILDAKYSGVCRGQWWPLRSLTENSRARALVEVHERELLGNLVLGVDSCADRMFLRSYLEVCDELNVGPLFSLVCVAPDDGPSVPWVANLQAECVRLGVDVAYGSGSFSFINSDFAADDEQIAAFFAAHLNGEGLFSTIEDARAFMMLHHQSIERGNNLETLDGAMPIELWEDPDLSRLRKMLQLGA